MGIGPVDYGWLPIGGVTVVGVALMTWGFVDEAMKAHRQRVRQERLVQRWKDRVAREQADRESLDE